MADEPQDPKEGEPQGEPEDTTDWKAEARKHERRAKKTTTDLETAQGKITELEGQVEQLKAGQAPEIQQEIEKARREARREAQQELEGERRQDRLQVAVARHARDLADVDDVVLNLRASDTDDLFGDDGQVDTEALSSTLSGLLERKPHLRASGSPAPQGDPDAGRGEGAAASPSDPGAAHNADILASLGLTRQ